MIFLLCVLIGVVIGAVATSLVFVGADVAHWWRRRTHAQRIAMPRGRVVHLEGWRRR